MTYDFKMICFYEKKHGGISEPETHEFFDVPEDRVLNIMSKEMLAEMVETGVTWWKMSNVHFRYELIKEAK